MILYFYAPLVPSYLLFWDRLAEYVVQGLIDPVSLVPTTDIDHYKFPFLQFQFPATYQRDGGGCMPKMPPGY